MNLVCTSCIQAAECENWSATVGGEPADLCISLGAQMDAHDCLGGVAMRGARTCACAYPHDGGLMGNDPIKVLELGRQYARSHGHNAIAAEGMHRAICRALTLLELDHTVEWPKTEEPEPNTDNLVGIRCPKCGSYEPFVITFEATHTVHDEGILYCDENGWKLDSDIVCATCQHKGIVGEFQKNLTTGDIMRLEGKEGKGRTMLVYPTAPKTSSPTVTIPADAHSDDHAVYIKFDALAWFREVSAENILKLAKCGWGGDYPADAVVTYMQDYDENVKRLFSYLEINRKVGYECHVNEESAMAWLADNRPEVHEVIQREAKS